MEIRRMRLPIDYAKNNFIVIGHKGAQGFIQSRRDDPWGEDLRRLARGFLAEIGTLEFGKIGMLCQ